MIGVRVRKAGYSIRLSHHVIENVNRRRSFRWFLNRHSRWYKIRRQMALPTFLIEPAANLATVGLVWAFSGDSGIAWGGLLLLVGLGMVRDAVQTRRLRGSFPKSRHLLYSPVKDILMLPLWFDAIMNRRVQWRGHRFSDRSDDPAAAGERAASGSTTACGESAGFALAESRRAHTMKPADRQRHFVRYLQPSNVESPLESRDGKLK